MASRKRNPKTDKIPGDKGARLTEAELTKRYRQVQELKAQVNRDYNHLIKQIRREHYDSLNRLHALSNIIKKQAINDAETEKHQLKMEFSRRRFYTKTNKGYRCKLCKNPKTFYSKASIHIHLGRMHQKEIER